MLSVLILALAAAGCASPTPTATPVPTATATPAPTPVPVVALTVNGNVTNTLQLTLADLRAMAQQDVSGSYVKNNATQYVNGTGPSLNAIITRAAPAGGAANVTFTGADGYNKTLKLSVILANATVVIGSDGSLRDVVPGQAAGSWVSNLTTITVKA